jgi:O-antigen ligase
MRGAEALVLAFLAGALVRGWTLHRFRGFPSNRLHVAALLFGFVVAASCVEQIWLLQIQRDLPAPFLQDLFSYAGRSYVRAIGGYTMIFHGMLLLEGLALLLLAGHYSRSRPEYPMRLVTMLIIGATGAALVNIGHFLSQLFGTGQPVAKFSEVFTGQRWTVHIGDVNAAASFFVMLLLIAFSLAWEDRPKRGIWAAAGAVSGLALWMTASRTAMVAVLIIAVICAAVLVLRRSTHRIAVAAIAIVALVGSIAFVIRFLTVDFFSVEAIEAIGIRRTFLLVTVRMLEWQPAFGVGIGQYQLWSPHFIPTELSETSYARENAHNQFAQIAGELGIVGLATFVGALGVSLWHRGRSSRPHTPVRPVLPVLLGLGAFILTWLGGHPLLVAEVAYPFWMTLGIVPGLISSDDRLGWKPVAAAAVMALALSVSIPSRVGSKQNLIDSPAPATALQKISATGT